MDPFASAREVAAFIRNGAVSPLEVADCALARVARLNPQLNAITWRRAEALGAEARATTAWRGRVDWDRQRCGRSVAARGTSGGLGTSDTVQLRRIGLSFGLSAEHSPS